MRLFYQYFIKWKITILLLIISLLNMRQLIWKLQEGLSVLSRTLSLFFSCQAGISFDFASYFFILFLICACNKMMQTSEILLGTFLYTEEAVLYGYSCPLSNAKLIFFIITITQSLNYILIECYYKFLFFSSQVSPCPTERYLENIS